jgi:protein-disulfide isomerase
MIDNQNDTQLTPPVSERDHMQGGKDACVTLVEYGDFECPSCGAAYPTVKKVQQRMGDRLRFVYRDYPLPQHPHAEPAAEVAEAAGVQGKFWQMHNYLFEHQKELDNTHLWEYAQAVGLDMDRFEGDMEQHTYRSRVEEDVESGDQSGVQGTPTFYINGVLYDGAYNPEALQSALEDACNS